MKKGLIVAITMVLSLALGGCTAIDSITGIKDNVSSSADSLDNSKSKISNIFNKLKGNSKEDSNVKDTEDEANENKDIGQKDNKDIKDSKEEENTNKNELDNSQGERKEETVTYTSINDARSQILRYATYLEDDINFVGMDTIDNFISKDAKASYLLGVKMYHFEQNIDYSPDEFYYNSETNEVFVARQGILFRLNDYEQVNSNTLGVFYDIHDVIYNIDGKTYSNYTSSNDIKVLYEEADKELNRVWQQLKNEGKVTDSLVKAELEWIEYKDGLSSYSEKFKATQDRINFLNSLS